jgi:DNA repair protein RecN (Recombination protein N)
MLKSIYVKNFILFEELELKLGKGLTVFTGETGAGKSLLVEAFSLLCGKQASPDYIRIGAEEAIIEGELVVSEEKLDDDFKSFLENGRLVITRKLSRDKSSVVRLNGQSISLKQLRQLMKDYVSIVGQHDYMNLCDESFQLALIDSQSKDLPNKLLTYQACYRDYLVLQKKLNTHQRKKSEISHDLDLAKFQYDELDSQHFELGEDVKLEDTKRKLKVVSKGKKSYLQLSKKYKDLADNAQEVHHLLKDIVDDDLTLKMQSFVENITIHSTDFSSECESKRQEFEQLSTLDIDQLESRLDTLFKFKKKYGVTSSDDLLEIKGKLKKKLDLIDQSDDDFPKLERSFLEKQDELKTLSKGLDACRRSCLNSFESMVNTALKELNIAFPQFSVDLNYEEASFHSTGSNTAQYSISTNPGQPSSLLKNVASGGELSRILLAIQSQSPHISVIPTLLYDEIDTGVGGLTANSIGHYLSKISEFHQIIVVTHLPQIAQFSSHHFLIDKLSSENKTDIVVSMLDKSAHKRELERMVGGQTVLSSLSS